MMPPAPSIAERSGEDVARGALGKTLEAGDYEILRLAEPRFDIDRLVAALERVRRRFPLRPRNDDPTYRGICLQTSGDTDDPLYGLVNLRPARERPAVEPTAIAGEFAAVFAALSPHVALDRGRLLEIHPGHVMPFHSDGPGNRRLHIPIITAGQCFLDFEDGGSHHLPADGSCFLANTERGHRARNPLNGAAHPSRLPGAIARRRARRAGDAEAARDDHAAPRAGIARSRTSCANTWAGWTGSMPTTATPRPARSCRATWKPPPMGRRSGWSRNSPRWTISATSCARVRSTGCDPCSPEKATASRRRSTSTRRGSTAPVIRSSRYGPAGD